MPTTILQNRRVPVTRPSRPPLAGINSPSNAVSASTKRPRSPELHTEAHTTQASPKRAKVTPPSPSRLQARDEERQLRQQRKMEREAQKTEFRVKYTQAFPSWVFHFDLDTLDPDNAVIRRNLESKVRTLGARVDDFFSNEITHLITSHPVTAHDTANKENTPYLRPCPVKPPSVIKSPLNMRSRTLEETTKKDLHGIVKKAMEFGMKIWSITKLESVLERCQPHPPQPFPTTATITPGVPPAANPCTITKSNQRSLTRLLQSERIHGTTERDPTQRRHGFLYFSRSSHFVLVEDIRQELATIAVFEYSIVKGSDGTVTPSWPILHCHPQSRGPFIAFDEREKRRWERLKLAEATRDRDRERKRKKILREELLKKKKAQLQARKTGDLRRSLSMGNFHRRATVDLEASGFPDLIDLDADAQDSVTASGYLASTGTGGAYIAASGNSVGITSTTGTTSTTDNSLRNLQLPAALRDRIQQQVVTSRKSITATSTVVQCTGKMGPPVRIPDRPLLRKSRSMNTLRLPKREEGNKPGYCESCRQKFDDFKLHVTSRKHRKFATDDANFFQLDFLLERVRRKTIEEVEAERRRNEALRGRGSPSSIEYDVEGDDNPASSDEPDQAQIWEPGYTERFAVSPE